MSSSNETTDPTLKVAERQLKVLGELAQMGLEVSRSHAAAALAAAHAVEVILDEDWQADTARALALAGSRNAAEAFQKVSRALRLTLVLEMKMAECIRDLRAGVAPIAGSKQSRADQRAFGFEPHKSTDFQPIESGDPADAKPSCDSRDSGVERLVDIERPDRIQRGTFRDVVDQICADLAIVPDWESYGRGRPALRYESLRSPVATRAKVHSQAESFTGPDSVADLSAHPPP